MKHLYSEPNNSKEDRLFTARELLKSVRVVNPMLGTTTLYKLMRHAHAKSLLRLEKFTVTGVGPSCYTLCKREITQEQFEAAETLAVKWGYKPSARSLSWGVCTEYLRDYSVGKVVIVNGKDGYKRTVEK